MSIEWTHKDRTSRSGRFIVGGTVYRFDMAQRSTRYGRQTARMWHWSITRDRDGVQVAGSLFVGAPVANANRAASRFTARLGA